MRSYRLFRWGLGIICLFSSSVALAGDLPSPYDSVEVLDPLYHGWFENQQGLSEIFESESIRTVVEVGSWLGKSAMWMAERLPADGKIYAVDHWLGSVEHQPGQRWHHRAQPHLYQQFLSNVIHRGLTDKIVPIRMSSLDAAALLDVKPDLIYIDAGHDYESVKEDLAAWFPLVGEKTVFCGDDWPMRGVRIAVREFARAHGFEIEVTGRLWRIVTH